MRNINDTDMCWSGSSQHAMQKTKLNQKVAFWAWNHSMKIHLYIFQPEEHQALTSIIKLILGPGYLYSWNHTHFSISDSTFSELLVPTLWSWDDLWPVECRWNDMPIMRLDLKRTCMLGLDLLEIAQKPAATWETWRRDDLPNMRSSTKSPPAAADHKCTNDPNRDQKDSSREHHLNCPPPEWLVQ